MTSSTQTTESYGVTFWVKRYDDHYGMFKTHCDTRDAAFRLFNKWKGDGEHYFVQMGASSDEGAIVLNEWRK